MPMRSLHGAALLLLVFCLVTVQAAAQGIQTGTFRGAVLDQQALPVAGVTVTVTSPALQGPRSTTTGPDGSFVIRLLPPGVYQAAFDIKGFESQRQTVTIALGESSELTVTVRPGTLEDRVTVVATPAPLVDASGGQNVARSEVEALATSRHLQGIATLAPGVSDNTLEPLQLSIHGAFGFDNLFMANGVDIDDNIFGTPQELFIEDAIQETQVLTSGISAEFGRFSGGVVNAITSSGGNRFAGSFRLNFTNPAWTDETPFEEENDVERDDTLNDTYEFTFGGPIVRDQVWFFGAGRVANRAESRIFDVTGEPYTFDVGAWRGEGKVTATVAPAQTVQGGLLLNRSTVDTPSFSISIDPATLSTQEQPNWYAFGNYRGALSNALLLEAQFSERRLTIEAGGSPTDAIVDSPFFGASETFGHYNAPYFDPEDPEGRNNRQITGSVTHIASGAGTHEIKAGYEFFRSQNTGGGSQSTSGYVFVADYLTDDDGEPMLDADGRLIPVFTPGGTFIETYYPQRGAELNVDTNSFYAQDRWRINQFLSADVGFRFEHVTSEATGGISGVNANTFVPRLALIYDPRGDGRTTFHVTYGHYAGRYNENLVGENSNVVNADMTSGTYVGPAGQGRNFAPGFNPANYDTDFGEFPTANIIFDDGLSAPITKEFTVSGGTSIGANGHVMATYVWRRMSNLIEDFIEADNGSVDVVADDVLLGSFTNRIFRNSDEPERQYQAAVFQGRYALRQDLTLNGAWTIQRQNEGNYEGEEQFEPASPSRIGDFPEAFTAERNFPDGRLRTFQRHRARVWAIYLADLQAAGTLSVSGLWRFESGRPYSLMATNEPLTDIQYDLLSEYVDPPFGQDLYFGERGSETFPSHALFDVSVNYAIPVFRELSPWVKIDIFNLFNNDTLIGFDTTVIPDLDGPVDALGLPTEYIRGENFGEARGAGDFPRSLGAPGGRSFRMSVGVRF